MKLVKILFVIFMIWIVTGGFLQKLDHPKADIVMGLAVFFMAFILMPIFIYHRYKDGKYKKYMIHTDEEDKKI